MKPFFIGDMFRGFGDGFYDHEAIADHANALLQERGKVVYGCINIHDGHSFFTQPGTKDTHRALLVCIEELEKAPCEHKLVTKKTITKNGRYVEDEFTCDVQVGGCGKRLRAKWEIAE